MGGGTLAAASTGLARADEFSLGDAAERASALRAYRAAQHLIDPSGAPGCDRVEWVLDNLKAIDHSFEPLLRRAAESCLRSVVRRRACVALGAFRVAAHDAPEAEDLFLRVLSESRGRDDIPERAACLNLARLYRREWRLFEGYVMSRHAARLFRCAEDPIREVYSLTEICAFLCEMKEWEAFDALLPDVRRSIRELPGQFADTPLDDVTYYEVRAALSRGRPLDALALLDANLAHGDEGEHVHPLRSARSRGMIRAAAFSDLGRFDDAVALLEAVSPLLPVEGASRVHHQLLVATCAARQSDPEASSVGAEGILATPQETLLRHLGAGGALDVFVRLAQELRGYGHERLAREALDRAATYAVQRIFETERAVRELPELAQVSREDFELLGRARMRYAGEHRDLLRSLAGLFEAAAERGEPWLDALRSGDAALVCAWCERVRSAGGAWIPVGHYLPRGGPLQLTHGICTDCSAHFLG